jgi:SPP1 family predicted phage head-tail adaptor
MTIDPGTLNDRVTLQTKSESADGGFPEPVYTDLATVWAKFRPTGGREFREGAAAVGELRGTFTINYREDLTQVDQVVFNGLVWNIRSVARVGWKEALDLLCTSTGEAV